MRFLKSCALILSLSISALLTPPANAAPGDEHWSTQFNLAGPTNNIFAIALNGNRIYAGGYSTGASLTNSTLMVWDGIQWSTVANFFGPQAILYDTLFLGGNLYVAGAFTNVSGTAAIGLARFDGSTWSSMGLTNTALSLATEGNRLYVGGTFTNVAGVSATNIAYYDGAWHALGSGVGISGNGNAARSILVTNGFVYAAGVFTNAGPVAATNIAMWNGSSWASLGGGANNVVYGLAFSGPDLYAGGSFTQIGGISANFVARWNGANWSSLGSGLTGSGGSGLNCIAMFKNKLCVTGGFTSAGGNAATNFAVWDGATWASAGAGLGSTGVRLVATSSNLYVGGTFGTAGNGLKTQLTAWDGSNWLPIGVPGFISGLQTTVRSLASDGTNLLVGGGFSFAGQTNAARIARFDGSNYYSFGTGVNSNVNAIQVIGTNLYAAGDFTANGSGFSALRVARWTGTSWAGLSNFFPTSVSTLAERGNQLYIAGYLPGSSYVMKWDGTNATNVLQFDTNMLSAFYIDNIGAFAMAIQDTNIYVSARCNLALCDEFFQNCTSCSNVFRFDGTLVRLMGTGLSSNANAIVVAGTNVYFGGPFTNAGGVAVGGIARWDGNAWHDVGGGVVGRGTINALALMGTNLYAGGTFTNMGGVPANRIARWNGTTWSALGSGLVAAASSGSVLTLTAIGSDLYAGGTCRLAGGKPSYFLARWNEGLNFDSSWLQFSGWTGSASNLQTTLTAVNVPAYVIDTSSNLANWTPWLTNSVSPYDLKDTNAAAVTRKFLRARSLP